MAGALGWFTNRLLLPAIAIELAFTLAVLLFPTIATALGQAAPLAIGWGVAFVAPAALLAADSLDKWFRRRRIQRHQQDSSMPGQLEGKGSESVTGLGVGGASGTGPTGSGSCS